MPNHHTVLQPTKDLPEELAWRVQCPECSAPEIERGELDETGALPYDPDDDADSGDHTAVTVHPDRDAHDSPIGTRGGYVEIRLWCGMGHNFRLIVANHKGAEYLAVVR
ncbi:hypothetical protein [Streptomyces violaceus]|uniref:Uncharacterized protein n=1 Tax=Streptomyces violaceus TaxID=1936 RepID=A0ABY9UQK8_STRVL|nr:hypothetical protein [Streptomyces janthinus]WND24075.1 hypothetical protein RI060_42920 [Streptomyces janthinus]GGS96373.1 hypothetical protein GCM10010270_80430 [Streptomyces janthinus]